MSSPKTDIATNVAKKATDEPTNMPPAVVDNLCKDYAACCRVNLSEGQVQVMGYKVIAFNIFSWFLSKRQCFSQKSQLSTPLFLCSISKQISK